MVAINKASSDRNFLCFQCDIVNGYREAKESVQNVLEDMLPTLETKSTVTLDTEGK